jgi:hypothetical protein
VATTAQIRVQLICMVAFWIHKGPKSPLQCPSWLAIQTNLGCGVFAGQMVQLESWSLFWSFGPHTTPPLFVGLCPSLLMIQGTCGCALTPNRTSVSNLVLSDRTSYFVLARRNLWKAGQLSALPQCFVECGSSWPVKLISQLILFCRNRSKPSSWLRLRVPFCQLR